MVVESVSHRYQVGDHVADAGTYRLYLCEQVQTGRRCLLQIAAEPAHNGALDRSAFLLDELKRHADELEERYTDTRPYPEARLNYDLSVPQLVDSFLCSQQGGRRINILAFRNVEDVRRMVPISNITIKDRRRVDLQTSAWIMGKALKVLAFAHSRGIANRHADGANILIDPDEHYVVLFDWSGAHVFTGDVPNDVKRTEIVQAAQAVLVTLGGVNGAKDIPGVSDEYQPYLDFLQQLAAGAYRDAHRAHTAFYELIDELWERSFYPFTSLPLNH